MFRIVEAQEEHVEAIRLILDYYVVHTCVTWRAETPTVEAMKEKFEQRRLHPWLVALNNFGVVIGFAYAAKFRDTAGWAETAELSIYLNQESTGQGIGSALLSEMVSQCRRNGFSVLVSLISTEEGTDLGKASVAMHLRAKFQHFGLLKGCGKKFGRTMDCTFLSLSLK